MLIFIIDDEEKVLEETRETIEEAVDDAKIMAFTRGAPAIEAVREGEEPDVVFCDIEMPGLSGLAFAVEMKKASPNTRIIFVTGYEKYAVQAFKIKVHGYLLKPLIAEDVRDELKYLPQKEEPRTDRLVVHCFGHFDVYWKGKPVIFSRKQSKELLAYLIDRQGAVCTAGEIALALWEKEDSKRAEMQRVRNIISDLKKTLKQIGMDQVLIREHRQIAIRKELVDCDYYRMLDGDIDALNTYRGEYMGDYSWAELTNAKLGFIGKDGYNVRGNIHLQREKMMIL